MSKAFRDAVLDLRSVEWPDWFDWRTADAIVAHAKACERRATEARIRANQAARMGGIGLIVSPITITRHEDK